VTCRNDTHASEVEGFYVKVQASRSVAQPVSEMALMVETKFDVATRKGR
jgi:hypothetical protein